MNNMEYTDKEYCLEIWGDWACFTRPELKVERVSYDVITPSAARAVFEAILFKRYAMRWQVTKIEVLNPIKWTTIRRNEVGAVGKFQYETNLYRRWKDTPTEELFAFARCAFIAFMPKLIFYPSKKIVRRRLLPNISQVMMRIP